MAAGQDDDSENDDVVAFDCSDVFFAAPPLGDGDDAGDDGGVGQAFISAPSVFGVTPTSAEGDGGQAVATRTSLPSTLKHTRARITSPSQERKERELST